jgi:Undecaprenyl-phosphate glucose phosphotransferase
MSIRSEISDKSVEHVFARSRPSFPVEAIPYVLSTTDALIILSVSLFGALSYHWAVNTALPDLTAYFALGLIASFIHIVRLGGQGYYDFEQAAKPSLEIATVVICWTTTALLLAFFAFLFKIGLSFSRGSFVIFIVLSPVALLAGRKLEKYYLRTAAVRGAIVRRNSVLLGDPAEVASLEKWDVLTISGTRDVNRFMLSSANQPTDQHSSDMKALTSVMEFVRKNDTSEILLALPWHDTVRIDLIREQCKLLPISVRLLPDSQIRSLVNYASSAGQRQLSIEIQRAPLDTAERVVKRAIDVVFAILALVFFLPIMALTAIAIKLDGRGPVIFRQNRKGFNGKQFVMFKFRTMTVQENGHAVSQAVRNDPRVTGIGKLLRASSIDELPQLINVLLGHMSLIGPRPHALAHDSYFESVLGDYAFRHHVKPGMTGWAQVNGLRGATPTVEAISKRVKMDLWYVNNWSLWLDLQIILKTFVEVLRKRNAY